MNKLRLDNKMHFVYATEELESAVAEELKETSTEEDDAAKLKELLNEDTTKDDGRGNTEDNRESSK